MLVEVWRVVGELIFHMQMGDVEQVGWFTPPAGQDVARNGGGRDGQGVCLELCLVHARRFHTAWL